MMLDFGIRLADARQEEDELRAALSVVAAELDRDIRNAPDVYGVPKVTEATISNAILIQPEHTQATAALNTARHNVRILQAATEALDHRKRTLQGMTDLWLRQWYADPKSPGQPGPLNDAAPKEAPTKVIPGRRKRRTMRD